MEAVTGTRVGDPRAASAIMAAVGVGNDFRAFAYHLSRFELAGQ
ncbi:MAG: hypothetical protein JWM80_2788 [Cyanobacteria bacterium RYN_339]|nr:hypothetical protein [Cyanobacteria bacterium RYN_339]